MFETDAAIPSLSRFNDLISSILKITNPKSIIQIGVGSGEVTEKLLIHTEKNDGHLTCIDTYSWNDNAKKIISSSTNATWISNFGFQVVPSLNAADLYIIDDDYNYFTAHQELEACWKLSTHAEKPFLLLLRGTDWPFANRDAYHNPDVIPPEFRHRHSWTQGLFPDCSETSEDGLTFENMALALSDEGDKNGVLHAIWDFMSDKPNLKRINIPAFYGLSIIFSDDALWANQIKDLLNNYQENLNEIVALEENRLNFLAEIIRREFKFSKLVLAKQNQNFDTDAFCKVVQTNSLPHTDFGLVSIIIPTHNRPEMLRKAIGSALAQTYPNIEIVVVNDAGIDVKLLIDDFNDSRINYIHNPKNMGVSASRNIGIKHSKGKFIAYLDDDDCLHPNHINVLISALNQSGFKIAYTDTYQVVQEEVEGNLTPLRKRLFKSKAVDKESVLIRTPFYPICICHEKSCLKESGGFDEELHRHEDWDLWIRLALHYPFLHIPIPLSDYTTTSGQLKKMSAWNGLFLLTALTVHKKYRSLVAGNDYIQAAQLEYRNTLRYSALTQLQNMDDQLFHDLYLDDVMQKIVLLSQEFTHDDIQGAKALLAYILERDPDHSLKTLYSALTQESLCQN